MGIRRLKIVLTAKQLTQCACLVGILFAISACGDGGPKPAGFGALTGVVRVPFTAAAAGAPAAGARVHVSGGDFDSTTATDSTGTYFLGQVPVRAVTISASLTDCLSGSRSGVQIIKNDTISTDLTLESRAEFDTIPLPGSGAVRMEIVPGGDRAILLYDVTDVSPIHPSLVSVDLTTGVSRRTEFIDLDSAFDMKLVGDNMVVFNFLSHAGFGLRFVSLNSMAAAGGDVLYDTNAIGFAGHIVLDNSAEHVFVAHAALQVPFFVGRVFAVSVAERKLLDADNNSDDGNPAFDGLLIRNSIGWAYSIAYDDISHEILVGNRDAGFMTAIAWNKWGTFDRSAHLTMPVAGVRIVTANAQFSQFQPWFLGFAGGRGIAAWPQNVVALRFGSGAGSADLAYSDSTVTMASDANFLAIVPSRQSWFTSFEDETEWDASKIQIAVEERSWSTLRRLYRYESHHFILPDRGRPRAFAVDAANKKLYVAYSNRPILEVFCLP